MSRSRWHCRHPDCPTPHGAILGTLTAGGDLELDAAVTRFRFHPDTRRAVVYCPQCGTPRDIARGTVFSAKTRLEAASAPRAVVGLGHDNRVVDA